MTPRVAVSIAGTDSGGAAGLAADLTTFASLGVHGACVVTAVTAQDTLGVRSVHRVPVPEVGAQLDAVRGDLPVAAAKTGMLGGAAVTAPCSSPSPPSSPPTPTRPRPCSAGRCPPATPRPGWPTWAARCC